MLARISFPEFWLGIVNTITLSSSRKLGEPGRLCRRRSQTHPLIFTGVSISEALAGLVAAVGDEQRLQPFEIGVQITPTVLSPQRRRCFPSSQPRARARGRAREGKCWRNHR